MKKIILIAICASVTFVLPASAQTNPPYIPGGTGSYEVY